jgi:hypothetical protein
MQEEAQACAGDTTIYTVLISWHKTQVLYKVKTFVGHHFYLLLQGSKTLLH